MNLAQVTVELRKLLQLNNFELFDFEYTFDDPIFKQRIEDAVEQYYYNYEIGSETPQEFKRRFKMKWLGLIGYYNDLYNTTLLTYNPLTNYSISEALDQLAQSDATSSSEGKTDSDGTTIVDQDTSDSSLRTDNLESTQNTHTDSSDYPQAGGDVGNFLDGATNTDTSNTNTGTQQTTTSGTNDTTNTTNTSTQNEDLTTTEGTTHTNYEKTIEGLTGITYQELIRQERESLIRIIPMIIQELKPLFILVY